MISKLESLSPDGGLTFEIVGTGLLPTENDIPFEVPPPVPEFDTVKVLTPFWAP